MDERVMEFVNSLVGRQLIYLCCEAEILDFGFGELVLHGMGCSRIIKNNDILVTTLDYQSWDQAESTHNDEWFNLKRFHDEILGGSVVSVRVSPWHDLCIRLDNGVMIECLVANAWPHYEEALEQWVLFRPVGKGRGTFLTVYNKDVAFWEET